MSWRPATALCALLVASGPAPAKADDATASQAARTLPAITVEASRFPTPADELPAAYTGIDREDIGRGRPRLQPTDPLDRAPGVLVENRDNFAQNPRVSIRGFGSRAPFGIRGVQLRLDGIPLTTVDGQAQIDAIDPDSLTRIDVLRGANAVPHGNASGGLIHFHGRDGRADPLLEAGLQAGGFGLRRATLALAGTNNDNAGRLAHRELHQDGYRAQSAVTRRNTTLQASHDRDDQRLFLILNHLDNPLAQDPGGLTREEWRANPKQAAPLAARMDAGQRVRQGIASLGIEQVLAGDDHRLRAQGWLTRRDFHQQLPFPGDSLIDLDRRLAGINLDYRRPVGPLSMLVSLDLAQQRDARQRHCRNLDLDPYRCRETLTDDRALDQIERARQLGLALQLAGHVGDDARGRWVAGLRHDHLRLRIDDQLRAGGRDNSGRRHYRETHYSLGYSHRLSSGWEGFGQYATSFEAPTFTEFANPAGSGFRPGLKPQQTRALELGLRGRGENFELEVTGFTIRVRDELIIDDNPDAAASDERNFYRNAARTRRDGLELGGRLWPRPLPGLELTGALTWMNARLDDDSRHQLPGQPRLHGLLDIEYELGNGRFTGLEIRHLGRRHADDANQVRVDAQTVAGLRIGHDWRHADQRLRLTLGIDNLFNARHLANLRINAANGRYYEPGPSRRFQATLEWRYK